MLAVVLLSVIAFVGSIALYVVARCFHVQEDPRITRIEELLPGANCGGCGHKGCHDFAAQVVAANSLQDMHCPVGGADCMEAIAHRMGLTAQTSDPKVAVMRCAGNAGTKTPLGTTYQGPRICAIMNNTAGEYACQDSCLGCGDCVSACRFGAIRIADALPEVDADKCTACGACAKACPRSIIEIRHKGRKVKDAYRRVWVACSNCAKGPAARKQCSVACIGCGLCVKACPFQAITVTNNLSHIDGQLCRACGKCISACPTHAIHATF